MKKKTRKTICISLIVVLGILMLQPLFQFVMGVMYFFVDPIASLQYIGYAILYFVVIGIGIIYLSKKAGG